MEINTREAIRRIGEHQAIGHVEANRVLSAGLAGPGRRVGSAIVYHERALADLLARPRCSDATLDRVRPVIVRLGRGRDIRIDESWVEQAEIVRRNWYLPFFPSLMLDRWGCLEDGRFPLVATVASWVVFGAEVIGHSYDQTAPRRTRNRRTPPRTFEVEPPGAWFAAIQRTWLPLEHGPAITIWGAPTSTLRDVDWLRADVEEQKKRLEDERRARSAPVLREIMQVGLTSTDDILRAWNRTTPTAVENQAGQNQTTPPHPEAGRGGAA